MTEQRDLTIPGSLVMWRGHTSLGWFLLQSLSRWEHCSLALVVEVVFVTVSLLTNTLPTELYVLDPCPLILNILM